MGVSVDYSTSTSTPSDASSIVAIRHPHCVFDVLGRLKSRGLLLSEGFHTTGIRLADVGSPKCDMICHDVSKTAACETFAVLSDADCSDMLFALRLHSGPRDLGVRAAAGIRQRRDGRRKKSTEAEDMCMM